MVLKETHLRCGSEKIGYIIYTPDEFKPGLPLITFLHGAGERGTNTEHLYRHGIPKLIREGREYGAVILIPQCHECFVWNNLVEELKCIIDKVIEKYGINRKKVTLTGGSMGGFGAWEMGMTYPEIFSAIAPVCGGGLSWRAAKLSGVKVYSYHGAKDPTVPIAYSYMMVDACGKNAQLTVYDELGHNDTIDEAYRNGGLTDKLLSEEKIDFSPVREVCSEWF